MKSPLRQDRLFDFITNPTGGWRGVVVILGVGILINLFSEFIPIGPLTNRVFAVISIILIILGTYATLEKSKPRHVIPESELPPKFPGLIALVSSGRPESKRKTIDQAAKYAIDYHLAEKETRVLKVCWLIATKIGERASYPAALELKAYCEEKNIKAYICTISDGFDVQETYKTVRDIYENRIKSEDLEEKDIIADFTGGVRPMTAGVILACGNRRPMQYMAGYDPTIIPEPRFVTFA